MHNIKLKIAYDGYHYAGWQNNQLLPSIEGILQSVIKKILQQNVILQAASRTDAGVHANGQIANFFTSQSIIDLPRFLMSLNQLLPKDIRVLTIEEVSLSFHPSIDCVGKEYHYYVCYGCHQLPHHRFYSWHVPYPFNLYAIEDILPDFIGMHDFRAFCNIKKNRQYENYLRHIQLLEIDRLDNQQLRFRVKGNHFLYKMVRNLIGTFIDYGRGKFTHHHLKSLLLSKERGQAGVSAPAHGLFLHQVFYPEDTFN